MNPFRAAPAQTAGRSRRSPLVTQKIGLLSLLSAACATQARPPPASSEAAQVRITRAQARPEERWLAGNVSAARHAQISTRTAATVRGVRVREGDRVPAGAVLVRLVGGGLRARGAGGRAGLEAGRAHATVRRGAG